MGKPPANVAPVTVIGGKTYAIPWYIMPAFWYVWRDVFEKNKVKLPNTFEEAKAAARRSPAPRTTSTAWARAGTARPTATASCRA